MPVAAAMPSTSAPKSRGMRLVNFSMLASSLARVALNFSAPSNLESVAMTTPVMLRMPSARGATILAQRVVAGSSRFTVSHVMLRAVPSGSGSSQFGG